jgi:hypothetical protein
MKGIDYLGDNFYNFHVILDLLDASIVIGVVYSFSLTKSISKSYKPICGNVIVNNLIIQILFTTSLAYMNI